jgi:GT2 family glycosyltransferase
MAARASQSLTLAAVVVTFNRRAQIEITLDRLLAEPVDHVIVVDNGSTDGTRDWFETLTDPRLRFILAEANLGGAGGFEAGLRAAMAEIDPDWIVVMDDDARPEPGALTAFRGTDLTRWDAVAAAVRYPDGRVCEMNRPWVNPFWDGRVFLRTLFGGGRAAFHMDNAAYASGAPPRPIDGGSFVGLFLSRAAIHRAGYPDPRLFIYGDDVLYTLDLSERGGRIGFLPAIRFDHDCATITSGRQIVANWKVYYHYRNLLLVYHRAAGWLFWPALALILPKWAWKARLHAGEDRRTYLRLLGRAVKDGLLGRLDDQDMRP